MSEDLLNDAQLALEGDGLDSLGIDLGFDADEGFDVGGDLLDDAQGVLEDDFSISMGVDEPDIEESAGSGGVALPNDPLADKVTMTRNGGHEYLSTMSEFTSILSQTGIHGPRHLRMFNLTSHGARIGRGAQFTVYRHMDHVPNANKHLVIKRVNVPLSRDKDVSSYASSSDYRLQLRTLELEVLSLCNPLLRNNRNIVHLSAWGYDYPLPDTPVPVLFVEAALTTLTDFLKPENEELLGNRANDIRYQLALDSTAGIEALHQLRIVHGDVKPDNVLVFKGSDDKVPFIAKISDFGVCVDLESARNGLTIEDYRGTPDWLAPEIRDTRKWGGGAFKPEVMFRFDAYSLGLTILSVFVSQGEPVDLTMRGEDPADVAIHQLREQISLTSELRTQLTRALRGLLDKDPWKRSLPSSDLLRVELPAFTTWLASAQYSRNYAADVGTIDPMYNKGPRFWYRLDNDVLKELEQQLAASETDSFAADSLLGLAMSVTRRYIPTNEGYIDRMLTYITQAARRGYSPARAMYAQFMHAHDRKPAFSDDILDKWTLQAISEGYLFAIPSARISERELAAAKEKFRNAGGFCVDPFLRKADIVNICKSLEKAMERQRGGQQIVDSWGNTLLHAAAALGAIDVVRGLVEKAMVKVDIVNDNLETPIYKACQAGHVPVINYLLDKGAKASCGTKEHNLTTLHWLFNIPDDSVRQIAARLISESGADANSTMEAEGEESKIDTQPRTRLFHYPFGLPSGTPLHWAAFARNKPAIEVLLEHGANINATYRHSGPETTALSLATWYGETEIVRYLLSKGANGRATDSKGRNTLHAMTFYIPNYHGHVPYPWHYWVRHGNWTEHEQQMTELVRILVDAGADIESRDTVYPRSTPVVLAVGDDDGGAICALLAAGADVSNAKGTSGNSVLHEWSREVSSRLPYPESYMYVFEKIAEATEDVNVRNDYEEDTPLHVLIGLHSEQQVRKGCDILFNLRSPADVKLANRRGQTALFIALDTSQAEQDPEQRAFYLIKSGAELVTFTDDQKDIFWPVASNKTLSDQQSHDLIHQLLSQLIHSAKCDKKTSVQQVYKKYFLPRPGAILTLAAAVWGGRVKTTKLLLDLGLDKHINQVFKGVTGPHSTVLEVAIRLAESSRQAHLDKLAAYTPGPARDRALADKSVYDHSQGAPTRSAEAYASFPTLLRLLRGRGAKRTCELDPVPNPEVLNMESMVPADHPDLYDVTSTYFLGLTPATQPNVKDWEIVYELARHPANWREQLASLVQWRYENGWRPDLDMLRDAARLISEQEKGAAAASTNTEVPDVEFMRNVLLALSTVHKQDAGIFGSVRKVLGALNTGKKSAWIEIAGMKLYGMRKAKQQSLEIEVFEDGKLGATRTKSG